MNDDNYREQDHLDAIRCAWHEHIPPKKYAPDGKLEDIGQKKPRSALWSYFFANRLIGLPSAVVTFSPINSVRKGVGLYDPIHNIWQKPVGFFRTRPSPHYMGDEEQWLCEQWRIIPSRFQSLIVRIVHYLRFPLWIGRWLKSYFK